MKTAVGRIVRDGGDFILLYRPEVGFGPGVDVNFERRGDAIIMTRLTEEDSTDSDPIVHSPD
jgi:hypothetical protein